MTLSLEARYLPATDTTANSFELSFSNYTDKPLSNFTLAYSAMSRCVRGSGVDNGTLLRRVANFHEIAPPEGLVLQPGDSWQFKIRQLEMPSRHRVDGPKSAFVTVDGEVTPVQCSDLQGPEDKDTGELRHIPKGQVDMPIYAVPFPQQVSVKEYKAGLIRFYPAATASDADKAAMLKIAALAKRLFPDSADPFRLAPARNGIALAFAQKDGFENDGYSLRFDGDAAELSFTSATGRDYGLTLLAQIVYGAESDPETFQTPTKGVITDVPRFGWRGSHLDVSRHFWPTEDILRFLDILAWSRMNVFQWHLTDDEGWRLEINAYPELTMTGAFRGPGLPLVSQHGYGSETYGGFYTQEEVRDVVAHGQSLNITIVPEIDIPGHCTAVLKAYPNLADPDEREASYHSIQGYANNALNPAIPETYTFLEAVFAEVAELFPSEYIHVGGDEVDVKSWLESPKAQALMAEENLKDTMELQAYFLRKVQAMLRKLDRKIAGWDEVSHGGGIDAEGSLLVAWQKPELTRKLIEEGYEVVCSPGQAYYLDMAQATGWEEPGAGWAGVTSPETSYQFEAASGLDDGVTNRLKGVQACIWCEHITNKAIFNHMVFPRLFAVAEAGWTDPQNKNWQRFAALSHHFPKL